MIYEISGAPVPWASHKGYGKKSFNPHYKEKQAAQWELKIQHAGRPLIKGAVRIDFFFEVPIPKSMAKKIRQRIESGEKVYCPKRPDRDNYQKYTSDVLTGAVLSDDNIIVAGETQKYYAREQPKTIIVIQEME